MCMVCGDPGQIQAEISIITQLAAASPLSVWLAWQGKRLVREVKDLYATIQSKIKKR